MCLFHLSRYPWRDIMEIFLEASAIGAINTLDGYLDADGKFPFILGPDVRRGSFSLTIGVETFSSIPLSVRFF